MMALEFPVLFESVSHIFVAHSVQNLCKDEGNEGDDTENANNNIVDSTSNSSNIPSKKKNPDPPKSLISKTAAGWHLHFEQTLQDLLIDVSAKV